MVFSYKLSSFRRTNQNFGSRNTRPIKVKLDQSGFCDIFNSKLSDCVFHIQNFDFIDIIFFIFFNELYAVYAINQQVFF